MPGTNAPIRSAHVRSARRLAAALACIAVAAAGCPKPTDGTPQIMVSPGAAKRIDRIASRAGRGRGTGPSETDAGIVAARVHPMKAGEELAGPNATGKVGDWVIENDEVVFVIDALGGGAGFAESGGNLIDAADGVSRRDELGQLFTYFGAFPRQGVYTAIDTRVEPDGTAVVASRGVELYEPTLEVVTEFRLGPADRALLLRTTLYNKGRAALVLPNLGDAIQWGGTEKLAPGKAVGFKGPSSGPFIGAVGRFASYAITSTDGTIDGVSGSTWTDTEQHKNATLAPGARLAYERVFVVGERPDVASIVSELTKASGVAVGRIEVALTDAKGAPARVSAGAKVIVGTDATPDILTLVAAKDGDAFGGEVPEGTWIVRYAPSVGRRAGAGALAQKLEVKAGATSRATLSVTAASALTAGPCEEPALGGGLAALPLPCKITIEGLAGTAAPDLGPAHVAGRAKNVLTLMPGQAMTVPLPEGRYRLTASRGPEYDLASVDVTLPGASPPPFVLRRVVATPGYVAADLHQHTILSADSAVSTRDRVLANAAEGVEVAVASEHNAVVDLAPIVRELGLNRFVVAIAGDELTSDASKAPFGHANVYPVVPQPDKPRGGAPVVRDRLARDAFADARALPGGPHVLQINHPRSGKNGYFDALAWQPATGLGAAPGYDASFDAIEVWNGRDAGHRAVVLEDFFALLRAGRPATPIADTDTHGIVGEEPGYPRTYVRVGSLDPSLDTWTDARSQELVRGITTLRDVVLTNGPFLRVSVNGAPNGGVASAPAGAARVKIRVVSAPWIIVDKAEVRLATRQGGVTEGPPTTVALVPKKNAEGAMVAEATVSLNLKADDAVVVIASGSKPMRPVLSGDDADITPWAMSAPIWIDVDGDGRALGRAR